MRVSVFFYKNIDPASVLWRKLLEIKKQYAEAWVIGSGMGFGADKLTWHEAMTLAARITVTVFKTESVSVFSEMRLLVQQDQEESPRHPTKGRLEGGAAKE